MNLSLIGVFFWRDHGMWESLGQGLNTRHSRDLSHSHYNAKSLISRPPGNS